MDQMVAQRRPASEQALSVAVAVASLGRPELVAQMRELMAGQTMAPAMLLFSVVSDADLPPDLIEDERCRVVMGPKGLPAQRNTALDWLGTRFDVVVFYDDDFIPARTSIAGIERFLRTHPQVVGATGQVIADGINSAGISREQAQTLLERHPSHDATPNCIVTSLAGLYGCNMAYRLAAIGDRRFDERLRQYGWQEDIDFAGQMLECGRIVRTFAFAGVHQGVKTGRTSGIRLGYSQMINPAYLVHKGTMEAAFAAKLMLRNFLANHIKALRPEPWVDRVGRVRGNWIGLFDLLRGRLTPERIDHL